MHIALTAVDAVHIWVISLYHDNARDAQIPGATLLWQLNLYGGTCYLCVFSMSPFWCLKFWVGSIFGKFLQLWTWQLRTRNCSSIPGTGRRFFSAPLHPYWLQYLPVSYCVVKGGSLFLRDKVAEDWSWPLTSVQCEGSEWVVIYLHPLTCLHGVPVDKFCYMYWQVYGIS
jgi:hypothetical protein